MIHEDLRCRHDSLFGIHGLDVLSILFQDHAFLQFHGNRQFTAVDGKFLLDDAVLLDGFNPSQLPVVLFHNPIDQLEKCGILQQILPAL